MKRGYLYILITTLLFSSMEVALKCIAGQLNPIQLNFSRFLVGGLVLVPLAVRELKKRGLTVDGKALGTFALLGLMGIAVSMSLYQLAVTRVQARSNAAHSNSSSCVFSVISDSSPPMMPAIASGPLSSHTTP